MIQVSSKLAQESSLHPKLITYIQPGQSPDENSCHLDVVYALPASVFVDPYQLQDLKASLGRATLFGEHDLELPLEKVKDPHGSVLILRQNQTRSAIQLELPFHLRYQQPSSKENYQNITIQAPTAGWTCGQYKYPPLSRLYPLITPDVHDNSAFHALNTDSTPLTLSVPIGKYQDSVIVTYGTFGAVVLCSIWITRSVLFSIKKRRRTEAKGKRKKSE